MNTLDGTGQKNNFTQTYDTTTSRQLYAAHKTINKTRCSYHVDFGDFTGFTTDLFI